MWPHEFGREIGQKIFSAVVAALFSLLFGAVKRLLGEGKKEKVFCIVSVFVCGEEEQNPKMTKEHK